MKLAAWILTFILAIYAIVPATFAEGISYVMVDGEYSLNELAACSINYFDGDTRIDLATADLGKTYKMLLTADESTTPFITDGYMVLHLPLEVSEVSPATGSNDDVNWKYWPDDSVIEFTWTNDKKNSISAEFEVKLGRLYDLYNIAKIGNSYYRLAKTKIAIRTEAKNLSAGKVNEKYNVEEYNFNGLDITLNGKTYVYADENFEQDPDNPAPFYTVTPDPNGVTVVYNKIGGTTGWLVDERYNDPNTTTGYHRDFNITLHDLPANLETQTLYNFLGVNGHPVHSKNFFRLNPTKIIAAPAENFGNNYRPKAEDYILIPNKEYDFTGVVLTVDGEEYEYRKSAPTEELYENYYTVVPDGVRVKLTMHESGKQAWLDNPAGYLDGSENTFGVTDNNVVSYHRDYKATIVKGNMNHIDLYDGDNKVDVIRSAKNSKPELPTLTKAGFTFDGWKDADGNIYNPATPLTKNITLYAQWTKNAETEEQKITYSSSLAGYEKVFVGTEITLTAHITGYGENYSVQWMYTTPAGEDHVITGQTGEDYTFLLDEENCTYTYYVVVTPEE